MKREKLAFLKWSLAIFFLGILFDHGTKLWAVAALRPVGYSATAPTYSAAEVPVITIIPGCLEFVYAENTGAAFSAMTGRTGILAIISLVACCALAWFWTSIPPTEKWGRLSVALILSGAFGNLVDRAFRGYVIDFIYAYFRQWSWPVFNIADSCICVGAIILGIRFLKNKV